MAASEKIGVRGSQTQARNAGRARAHIVERGRCAQLRLLGNLDLYIGSPRRAGGVFKSGIAPGIVIEQEQLARDAVELRRFAFFEAGQLAAQLCLRNHLVARYAHLADAHLAHYEVMNPGAAAAPVIVDAEQLVTQATVSFDYCAPRAIQVFEPLAGAEEGFYRFQQTLGRYRAIALNANLGNREAKRLDEAGGSGFSAGTCAWPAKPRPAAITPANNRVSCIWGL